MKNVWPDRLIIGLGVVAASVSSVYNLTYGYKTDDIMYCVGFSLFSLCEVILGLNIHRMSARYKTITKSVLGVLVFISCFAAYATSSMQSQIKQDVATGFAKSLETARMIEAEAVSRLAAANAANKETANYVARTFKAGSAAKNTSMTYRRETQKEVNEATEALEQAQAKLAKLEARIAPSSQAIYKDLASIAFTESIWRAIFNVLFGLMIATLPFFVISVYADIQGEIKRLAALKEESKKPGKKQEPGFVRLVNPG